MALSIVAMLMVSERKNERDGVLNSQCAENGRSPHVCSYVLGRITTTTAV